jgi:hypothetical protein
MERISAENASSCRQENSKLVQLTKTNKPAVKKQEDLLGNQQSVKQTRRRKLPRYIPTIFPTAFRAIFFAAAIS